MECRALRTSPVPSRTVACTLDLVRERDEDGQFGEAVAATYDETTAHLFDPQREPFTNESRQHVSVWERQS